MQSTNLDSDDDYKEVEGEEGLKFQTSNFTLHTSSWMVDLEEYFNYLIIERCNEIYYKIISKNADFQNLQAEIENCFEELLRVLPEPAQKEIVHEKLWGIIGTLEMLLPRLTYKQVLKDGVRMKGWID